MRIHAEIEDRYGKIPESVDNLFAYGRLRKTAEEMRILSVDKAQGGLAIKFSENARVDAENLMKLLAEDEGAVFSPNGILRVSVKPNDGLIERARDVLARIRK